MDVYRVNDVPVEVALTWEEASMLRILARGLLREQRAGLFGSWAGPLAAIRNTADYHFTNNSDTRQTSLPLRLRGQVSTMPAVLQEVVATHTSVLVSGVRRAWPETLTAPTEHALEPSDFAMREKYEEPAAYYITGTDYKYRK